MSSIVRKGQTSFVPKIKKNVTRRRNVSRTPDVTPVSTQEPGEDKDKDKDHIDNKDASPEKAASPLTPGPTQVTFYTGTTEARVEKSPEEVVDPMDNTKTVDSAIVDDKETHERNEDDDEEDYGDNDIFTSPIMEKPRRSSSVSHRRLSGIAIRRKSSAARSLSVSLAPNQRSSFGEAEVLIPVPSSMKAPRRPSQGNKRRKSVQQHSISEQSRIQEEKEESTIESTEADKSAEVSGPGETSVLFIESGAEEEADAEEQTAAASDNMVEDTTEYEPERDEVSRDELFQQGKYIIYALNNKRTKLVKYRTGPLPKEVEEAHFRKVLEKSGWTGDEPLFGFESKIHIPLAPERVVMKVSKLSEIPRRVFMDDLTYSQDIELDAERFTMKDLCNPLLPVGQASSNFELVKEAKAREKKARQMRQQARKKAKEERISYESALELLEADLIGPEPSTEGEQIIKTDEQADTKEEPQTKEEANNDNMPDAYDSLNVNKTQGLQLNITDGKFEVDADSTVVHRGTYDNSQRTREETNPFESPAISNTYSKRRHTDKWDTQEELEFFTALSTWGTDFSMISEMFPHRTRKQIKTKYNLEERKRPELIDLAFKRRFQVDIKEYEQKIGQKIGTLVEFEEARKRIKLEHEAQKKEILKEQEKAKLEDTEKNRRKEIERRSGQKPIERLTKNKTLRSNEEVIGTIDRK